MTITDLTITDLGVTVPAHDWRARAACRRVDPETLFPDPTDVEGIAAAARICGRCTVTAHCAALHTTVGGWGMWAGTYTPPETATNPEPVKASPKPKNTPEGRKKSAATATIRHGTAWGYDQHRARNEDACGPCVAAKREKSRAARERRRKGGRRGDRRAA